MEKEFWIDLRDVTGLAFLRKRIFIKCLSEDHEALLLEKFRAFEQACFEIGADRSPPLEKTLEDRVEDLHGRVDSVFSAIEDADPEVVLEELRRLREQLDEDRKRYLRDTESRRKAFRALADRVEALEKESAKRRRSVTNERKLQEAAIGRLSDDLVAAMEKLANLEKRMEGALENAAAVRELRAENERLRKAETVGVTMDIDEALGLMWDVAAHTDDPEIMAAQKSIHKFTVANLKTKGRKQ